MMLSSPFCYTSTMTIQTFLIDDLRDFRDQREATIARTSEQAFDTLNSGTQVEHLWLDHDLGMLADGKVDDVMRVVDWLCEYAFTRDETYPVEVIHVHTSNPVGARQMVQSLTRYGYRVVRENAPEHFIVND